MKKILYYTLLLAFAPLLLVGCKIDDAERNEKRTVYGYDMFVYTLSDFSYTYNVAYDAINLNSYINATTNAEKYTILERYFEGRRIEKLENGRYMIFSGLRVLMTVQTNGVPLDSPDVVWNIESLYENIFAKDSFTITNKGVDKLELFFAERGLIDIDRLVSADSYKLAFTTSNYKLRNERSHNGGVSLISCTDLIFCYNPISGYYEPILGWAKVNINGSYTPESIIEGTFLSGAKFELEFSYRGVTERYDAWDKWYRYY